MAWLTSAWNSLCAWAAGLTEWHFVNLFVPTLLPLAIIGVIWAYTWKPEANPWIAVKDGQLGWAALGMCCSAFFELRHPSPGVHLAKDWENTYMWLVCFSIGLSGLTAGIGPLTPTPAKRPPGFVATVKHFRLFVLSAAFTAYSAWLYANVHLTTQKG